MLNAMLMKLVGFFVLLCLVIAVTAAIWVPYCQNKYKPKSPKDKDDDCGCGGGNCKGG